MNRPKGKKRYPTIAQSSDPYVLYQQAVQAPEHEVWFFEKVYRAALGGSPRVLREDFCGTFAVCCEWVKNRPERTAVGVDIDSKPLDWGRLHNLLRLKAVDRKRVKLRQDDVRHVAGPKADVLAAQNFSFWYFKTRPELLRYFKAAYRNMASRGVMVLDMMGGSELMLEGHTDVTRCRGFKYHWEQARFDPITHDCKFHIHFTFKDGSVLDRAFTYEWRLWTVPEVKELLEEAGFDHVEYYWEGTNRKTGKGNEVYSRRKHAAADKAWVSYLVGVKK